MTERNPRVPTYMHFRTYCCRLRVCLICNTGSTICKDIHIQIKHDERPGRTGGRLRFDRLEFAGAFGDLGTLVPYVIAYAVYAKMGPTGMLLGLGLSFMVEGVKNPIEDWLIGFVVLLVTAAFSIWNVGSSFLIGLVLHRLAERGWIRF